MTHNELFHLIYWKKSTALQRNSQFDIGIVQLYSTNSLIDQTISTLAVAELFFSQNDIDKISTLLTID